MKQVYHWYSKTTGEIVGNFYDVVKAFIHDLFHTHFFNIRWSYSKQGY